MASSASSSRICSTESCQKEASNLQCPTCQKMGKNSFFCSQECFKGNWSSHKAVHKSQSNLLSNILRPNAISQPDPVTGHFNPFPNFHFTGQARPVYPLSARRAVPPGIKLPDYAADGVPRSEQKARHRNRIEVLDADQVKAMRLVCRKAREVLDIAAREVRPGITTDYIDKVVHEACLARDAYPSPLNYCNFPKSVCTSVNEIICHGIPDQRVLVDGDIVNIDVTLYYGGVHGDLNETYYVGDKALADPDSVRVVETARECLAQAIKLVRPGMLFREPGTVIEKHAKSQNCSVIKTYCGHGINELFHCAPNVPHYAKNKAVGEAKPGVCFTIEPMIALGTHKDQTWPDNWTSATLDGKRTAQFEHTLLVTEDGVEVLTERLSNSPGGAVSAPSATVNGNAAAPSAAP